MNNRPKILLTPTRVACEACRRKRNECGEGGILTRGCPVRTPPDYKSGALKHSATSPNRFVKSRQMLTHRRLLLFLLITHPLCRNLGIHGKLKNAIFCVTSGSGAPTVVRCSKPGGHWRPFTYIAAAIGNHLPPTRNHGVRFPSPADFARKMPVN